MQLPTKMLNDIKNYTCRACLTHTTHAVNIIHNKIEDLYIKHVLALCASVKIDMDDNLPKFICTLCLGNLNISYGFKKLCENSDRILNKTSVNNICTDSILPTIKLQNPSILNYSTDTKILDKTLNDNFGQTISCNKLPETHILKNMKSNDIKISEQSIELISSQNKLFEHTNTDSILPTIKLEKPNKLDNSTDTKILDMAASNDNMEQTICCNKLMETHILDNIESNAIKISEQSTSIELILSQNKLFEHTNTDSILPTIKLDIPNILDYATDTKILDKTLHDNFEQTLSYNKSPATILNNSIEISKQSTSIDLISSQNKLFEHTKILEHHVVHDSISCDAKLIKPISDINILEKKSIGFNSSQHISNNVIENNKLNQSISLNIKECIATELDQIPNSKILVPNLAEPILIGESILSHKLLKPMSDELLVEVKMDLDETIYYCDSCTRCFTTNKDLRIHKQSHGTKKVCDICLKQFTTVSALSRHNKVHTGVKSHLCTECGKSFVRSDYLMQHMRTHTGLKPFRCTYCDKSFTQSAQLQEHLRAHSGERNFICSVCGKLFTRYNSLLGHMKLHGKGMEYPCELCGKELSSARSLSLHMKTHGKTNYICNKCGKCFLYARHLESHFRVHTGFLRKESPYTCNECGKCFEDTSSLRIHFKKHTTHKCIEYLNIL